MKPEPIDRASTRLPPPPRRRRRRDWGALVAKAFCILFAILGAIPFTLGAFVRSVQAREWAVRETTRLLHERGVEARFGVELKLWPLAIELTHIQIASSDNGPPLLTTPRASVRPRFFALLSGKLAIDQIEVDAPKVRAVVQGGKLANLHIDLPKGGGEKTGPLHAPFSVLSIADATLDLDVDGVRVAARDVDLDVTNDDDPQAGSSFEIAVRVGEATLRRERTSEDGKRIIDDDALCSIDGRARVEPGSITVRRFNATGSADLDAAEGSRPRCDLPASDKRRVEVAMSHFRVDLPTQPGASLRFDGHAQARAPVALAERIVHLPETDGWVGINADVRYASDSVLPEMSGHFEAHDLRLERYRFAQEIQSDLVIQKNVVTSPRTMIRIADGVALLTDVTVEPLAKGVPLRAKLDVKDTNFTTLMEDLGVSQHPHVAWDLHELHVPAITGTIFPLHFDGDLSGSTGPFEVDDIAHDNPAHARILMVAGAELHSHFAVRPDALQFKAIQVKLPKSSIENGFVSIGFHNDIRVDVPVGKVDLADLSPLGTIALAGMVDLDAHVTGFFNDPHLEAEVSIKDFVFGDLPFGSVTSGHASLTGLVVDLKNVKAIKGKSLYEMPTARLDFGGNANMVMDAVVTSSGFGARDFFALWRMEDDPRFLDIDGTFAPRGTVHIALGGREDVCGNGFFDIRATAHATGVSVFGEEFDDGDVDLEYRWVDRLAGIDGADIDLRALTLHKVHAPKGPVLGSVLGSGSIARGGELNGSVVLQAIPLSRVQSLGSIRGATEGSLSGALQVGGSVEAYTARGDVDVTPVRIRSGGFGPSHLRVGMTQTPKATKPLGKTRCGGAIQPAFDKDAFLHDTSSQGEYSLDGELFGGQIALDHVTMTRQAAAQVAGKIALRKLDVGALALALRAPKGSEDEEAANAAMESAVTGELSGAIDITRLVTNDLGHASVHFTPTSLLVARSGQRITLRPTSGSVSLDHDTLTVPPLVLDLETPNGLRGACTVKGSILDVSRAPELALDAELEPVDLGVLVGIMPKVERSQGTLSGALSLKGKITDPAIVGALHVKGGEFSVHGWPGDVSEVNIDAVADTRQVRITTGSAKFAGGTITLTGSMPLKGLSFNQAEATIAARDIHVAPAEGVSTTFDADLNVSLSNQTTGAAAATLPHVSGDVLVTSFEYTRPINLELNAFGVRSKRTNVETYDPTLDAVVFDSVRVRSRAPFKIRNNLVEVQLGIDSGALTVTGTDQRVGLRGELRAQPGGRFHLRANDFEVRQALIRFDDSTRIAPNVDVLAVTEYRRYSDTSAAAAAGGTAGGGGIWRISLHAYGDTENLRFEMTSDPALSQEDIVLLLTIGMTRAEIDQMQAGSLGASAALEALATVSGADRAVTSAIPVIDDFRFGSAYSTVTGRTEPQVIVGKRLTDSLRANVATTVAEDRELRSNIEWRLNRRVSVQGSYDNINDISSSAIGNIGVDFRWRLEFE